MRIPKLYSQITIVLASAVALQACSSWPTNSSTSLTDTATDMRVAVPVTPALLETMRPDMQEPEIPSQLLDFKPEPYTLGPGDKLFVTVWDYPELTLPGGDSPSSGHNLRVIDQEGRLFFPFVGSLKAAGFTEHELKQRLTSGLERFIRDPQVDVRVAAYESRWVMVQGAFKQPGEVAITQRPLSLSQAVERGQVDRSRADISRLKLIRGGETYTLDYARLAQKPEGANQIYLQHGDRVQVNELALGEIAVLGEVASPGAIPLTDRKTSAAQALAKAGGPATRTADPAAIYIIRPGPSEAEVYQLDASNPAGAALMSQFAMRSDDVLYVAANSSARWTRMINMLLPGRSEQNPNEMSDIE